MARSFLTSAGLTLYWMLSPDALVILGNNIGRSGMIFFVALTIGAILSLLTITLIHDPAVRGTYGGLYSSCLLGIRFTETRIPGQPRRFNHSLQCQCQGGLRAAGTRDYGHCRCQRHLRSVQRAFSAGRSLPAAYGGFYLSFVTLPYRVYLERLISYLFLMYRQFHGIRIGGK